MTAVIAKAVPQKADRQIQSGIELNNINKNIINTLEALMNKNLLFPIMLLCSLTFINKIYSNELPQKPAIFSVNSMTISGSEVSVSARTHYDLQSNGVIHYIYQDPSNPLNLHAIFTVATDPAPWNTRNAKYFFSNDGGVTWSYVGAVSNSRSGYPVLSLTNDGRAVVAADNNEGGNSGIHLYIDVAPGIGSWNMLFPPGSSSNPEICVSSNNKLLFAGSGTGGDQKNVCTNLNPPGTFLGYTPIPNGVSGYACATGTGKFGIAYCDNNGGAALIESTNDGVTWSSPIQIWTWNPADSLGTLRSIDLIYEGSNPRVLVGLAKELSDGSNFFPKSPGEEVLWAPDVNGGTPILVDSAHMIGSNPVNDIFVGCCRGVLGKSSDGSLIYAAYNKTSGDTDAIGDEFFDVYFTYSTNHGATWAQKTKLTNLSGPIYDYRYVSISPSNDGTNAYIITQKDSIPASSINGAADSQAKMWFIKVSSITQTTFTVSGTVTYRGSGQPVTAGSVKAMHYDIATGNIITYDSTGIQPNGQYTLSHVPQDTCDIMFYQNDDILQFVPTYYVSTTDWRQAAKIYPTGNLNNINGQVFGINNTGGSFSISGLTTSGGNTQFPIKDAVIYVQSDTVYKNYGISLNNGLYMADKLLPGNYTLTACRMGYAPVTQNVTITNTNVQNINFDLGNPIGIQPITRLIPKSFNLYQNYPNPFNPETVIKFDIPKDQRVKIVIYDITGREVNKLLDEEVKAGSYSVRWDGSNYASGIYFYRIETETYTLTKKMILIK